MLRGWGGGLSSAGDQDLVMKTIEIKINISFKHPRVFLPRKGAVVTIDTETFFFIMQYNGNTPTNVESETLFSFTPSPSPTRENN